MPKLALPRLTFWRGVLLAILAAGTYATFLRVFKGLAGSTNLTDAFPWGLWIGFDILCGVALAAGGFTISATVYIFNLEKFRPIVRPAILTAFLGYVLVVVALLFDLGRPWNVWHPLVMWNPHSVMFEVGWCVTLYTTVLALEFSPVVFERFKMTKTLHVLHVIMPILVVLGVLLSTLHQSSLGSFYLIVPTKLHALWYSPLLPVYFFLTALTLGCAMTIVESFLSHRAFGKELEMELLVPLGRVALLILGVTAVIRFADFRHRGILGLPFAPTYESRLFLAEMIIGVLAPAVLLALPKVRQHRTGLFLSALLIVMGVVMNRLNVSITGMERSSGEIYVPAFTEIAITLSVVGVGFLVFALAVKYLPVFPEHEMKDARPPVAPEGGSVAAQPIRSLPMPA
ncbi:MAG TPA: Ni/Fe-hydrogenase cytochrome b subunit, partial [Thermoanaerobaculia bacterium]|nr:Ni/Fe-hydrogenase cytochrome b subunit [Thermoanaerobaculia bacterium]